MHLKFFNDNQLYRTSKGNQTHVSPPNHHGNSSGDPKSDAALQYVTKIDAVLPRQNTSPRHLRYYHRAWVVCCFVTPELSRDWLLRRPMRSTGGLCCRLFQDKRGTCCIKRKRSCADATMLKNFHYHEAILTKCALVDRRDGYKNVTKLALNIY